MTPESVAREIIEAHPDKFEQLWSRRGNLGWFVGQALKACNGRFNPLDLEQEFLRLDKRMREK